MGLLRSEVFLREKEIRKEMVMKDMMTIKLCLAILGQGIIDAYQGAGKVRTEALEWFRIGYPELVELLSERGVRFRDIFSFQNLFIWKDIPRMIEHSPGVVYLHYKAISYIEGISGYSVMAEEKNKIKMVKAKGRLKQPVQLVHPALIKIA